MLSFSAVAGPMNAYAADYAYNSSKNYSEYTASGLTVRFTLTNSGSMSLSSCDYAFKTDNASGICCTV